MNGILGWLLKNNKLAPFSTGKTYQADDDATQYRAAVDDPEDV